MKITHVTRDMQRDFTCSSNGGASAALMVFFSLLSLASIADAESSALRGGQDPPSGMAPVEEIAPFSAPAPASLPGLSPAPAPASVPWPARGDLPTPSPAPANEAALDPLAECFEVPRSICLSRGVAGSATGGGVVMRPTATPPGLVLWYQFDKALPVDDSGNGRHLLDATGVLAPVNVGPGVMGRGASASFNGTSHGVVRGVEALASETFTAALWVYVLADSAGRWRTIFSLGSGADGLSPALLLRPDSMRLHARITKRGTGGSESVLESVGLMPLKRWTHLAVSCAGGVLRLYINGIKDGEVILDDGVPDVASSVGDSVGTDSQGGLYLGRDPWRAGISAYIDDFRWYDRPLAAAELKALTFPSLTGPGAEFTRLGCLSCSYAESALSCGRIRGSHLCSSEELLAGGLQTARAMGWLAVTPRVWHRSVHEEESYDPKEQKLGLCCLD
eukprot:TRINITY_DN46778_c0_g1_i1.p1 TRINITY_DN46778_c0_g1~~TRINITY_DN46778_c0_g1_i1.p1  ORF type:complete len:477 (+),score=70.97 TRINITY_DN46778_c0_g1_i1:87-1433(+)